MACPGSMVMAVDTARSSSEYSAWGTLAHDLAAKHLTDGDEPAGYLGRIFNVDGFDIEVDQDMVDCISAYAETVRDYQGDGALLVEQKVCYAEYLGLHESQAWGTADAIIARDDELIVVDLKTGMGVEVSAERNTQMSMYALGALAACQGLVGDFTRVRMVISQPRIKKAPSEWDISVDELETWARSTARSAANSVLLATEMHQAGHEKFAETFLRPGEKQCRWCSAKATCPALRDDLTRTTVQTTAASPDEFGDLTAPSVSETADQDWLEAMVAKADMFEDLLKAARAELERRLLAGVPSTRFKVVQGKRGNRQWADPKAAEQMLKTFRVKLEDMYDMKLISPASAEKLAKVETIGKRQWPKLAELITQSDGKPHVAPVSDPRPALEIKPVVEDFENVADDLA